MYSTGKLYGVVQLFEKRGALGFAFVASYESCCHVLVAFYALRNRHPEVLAIYIVVLTCS